MERFSVSTYTGVNRVHDHWPTCKADDGRTTIIIRPGFGRCYCTIFVGQQ